MRTVQKLPEDLKELLLLVRAGKLFAVQQWISEGKNHGATETHRLNPVYEAMELGFHSMVEVFLRAGLEQRIKDDLLDMAVDRKRADLVRLCHEHGADLKSYPLEYVFSSLNPEMIRYFLDNGADTETGKPFAKALRGPIRPLLGIFIAYKDKIPSLKPQLDLALRYHAMDNKLRTVCLLIWAGADPHPQLPNIPEEGATDDDDDDDDDDDYVYKSSAIEEAARNGNIEMVKKMKIDPIRDNLNRLLDRACWGKKWELLEYILNAGAKPQDGPAEESPMSTLIWQLVMTVRPYFKTRSDSEVDDMVEIICRFADRGARFNLPNTSRVRDLRRAFTELDANRVEKIMLKFHAHKVCSSDDLFYLINTPRLKQHLGIRFPALKSQLHTPR